MKIINMITGMKIMLTLNAHIQKEKNIFIISNDKTNCYKHTKAAFLSHGIF